MFRSLHSVAITFESHHVSVFRSASHSQIRNFQNHPYCCSPPSTSPPSSRTRSPKRTSRNSPGSPGAGSAIARTLSPGLRSLTFTKTSSSTPRNQQRLNPSPASPLQGRLRTTSAINSKNPLLPPRAPAARSPPPLSPPARALELLEIRRQRASWRGAGSGVPASASWSTRSAVSSSTTRYAIVSSSWDWG